MAEVVATEDSAFGVAAGVSAESSQPTALRTRAARLEGSADELPKYKSICPEIRSDTACGSLFAGTMTRSMPARANNSTGARWLMFCVPATVKLSLPGLALA